MGGKKKQQAQRTKNNAQPSSSGRTAELMATNLGNIKGFGDPSYSANLSPFSSMSLDLLDPQIDPNFQVVLKKMSKKDGITRHKALTEFVNLCNECEDDAIKSALPSWTHFYCNLALDVEHRVREAAQHAHHAIVSKVGRNLAPYVKQIAPVWFISQYDTYAPAASAALNSFEAAFPSHKLVNVIIFCQDEILQYISHNILNQTPESMSKNEKTSREDMEAKYERILISSLNGYALYLSKISKEHLGKVESINANIITSNKFWKIAKHKNGAVRAAWFALISSVLQFAPQLIENEHKRLSNTVLGRIDDYDPVVLPNVWEATLLIVTGIKDCWQHVNMEKLFMPKFSHILAQGGQGNATFIYPNIILLLSNISNSVLNDKLTFFGKIFSSFKKGLNQTSVKQSHSESEAVVTSFIECIQYLILVNPDDMVLCNTLIEQHVLEVLNTTMLDSSHHHHISPLFNSLAQMLIQWKNNETTDIRFKNYSEQFWATLISIYKNNINKCLLEKERLSYLFDSSVKMLDFLFNRKCKRKKSLKVKFSSDENNSQESNLQKVEAVNSSEIQLQSDIILMARELTQECFRMTTTYESNELNVLAIKQLWKIFTIFKKEQIDKIIEGYENDLCKGFLSWIKDVTIPTEPLVGVVFVTIDSIQNEELKEGILLELAKKRSADAILESAKLATSYNNETLLKWLKSPFVKDELLSIYKTINCDDSSVDVLHQCLRSDKTGFLIGEDTVLSLLSVITEQLNSETTTNYKNLTAILDTFFTKNNPNCLYLYKNKLLELLYLCFQAIITDTDSACLFVVWRKGLNSLGKILDFTDPLFFQHITLCANFVASYINEDKSSKELNLFLVTKVCVNFIGAIVEQDVEKMSNIGLNISNLFLNSVIDKSIDMYQEKVEELCMTTEIIHGSLYCKSNAKLIKNSMIITKEKWDPLKDINFISYIRSLIFCEKFILYLIDDSHIEDDVENGLLLDCIIPSFNIGKLNDIVQICLKLCHGLVLSQTLKRYYCDTKQYFIVGEYVDLLRCYLKEFVHRLETEQQLEILSLAEENSNKLDKQWSQTLTVVAIDILDKEFQLGAKSLSNTMSITNENGLNIEYMRALRNDILNDSIQTSEFHLILDELIKLYKRQTINSYSKDLGNFDGVQLNTDAEIARLLNTIFVHHYTQEIDKTQCGWDFIMISVASWMKSISLTKTPAFYKEFVGFVVAVCDLYSQFLTYLINNKDSKIFEEWKDVFLTDTNDVIGTAWEFIANKTVHQNLNYIGLIHLKKLSESLCQICQIEEIRNIQVTSSNYDVWLNMGRKFITSPSLPVQLTSYNIFLTVVPLMVKLDSTCDENDLRLLTCENIKDQFLETQSVVITMLQDFSLGVSCSVAPFTDSYTYTLGYILIWSVLLEMCKLGDSQIRYIYTLWIKEMNLIVHIMESLLKLMPDSILHCLESNLKKRQDLFTEKPRLSFDGWESERLSKFCCWLFCDILRTLPAVARQWSAETDPKLLSYADKIATSYVSLSLCAEEMKAIMDQQKGFDNMKITTHPSVREVQAVYTVEESSTELIITLATNHPLSPPKVEIPKAMISSNQTRQWLMQLTIFLTHQNGSIWDGLLLWKSNLDKKFEGIEECYICFSILHNTSHQLPKLTCQTCKKKFHSFCLYKWFTTSNKSTCPICRNHF